MWNLELSTYRWNTHSEKWEMPHEWEQNMVSGEYRQIKDICLYISEDI